MRKTMVSVFRRIAGKETLPASRAFSYIRFSSKKQQKGESFRRQAEFAIEICRENGWVLDESLTLNDLGVSAFRGANAKVGALEEFLGAIRIGRVLKGSILIIESIDLLSRSKVGEALQLFISILNSGVSIVTREPRRIYTQDSINDIAALLEPIIYMSRADEALATLIRPSGRYTQKLHLPPLQMRLFR
jgi:DNA invertase Pin-like site-specific DNA recombinase